MKGTASKVVLALTLAAIAMNLSACGPAPYLEVTEPTAAMPAEGMARVYFVMPGSMMKGTAIVADGQSVIGYLQNGTWFGVDVAAGQHMFLSENAGNMSAVDATVEAGKSYFVKLFVTPGFMSTNVFMAGVCQADEDWANRQAWLDTWKQIKENPEYTDQWEASHAGKLGAAIAKVQSGAGSAGALPATCGE